MIKVHFFQFLDKLIELLLANCNLLQLAFSIVFSEAGIKSFANDKNTLKILNNEKY